MVLSSHRLLKPVAVTQASENPELWQKPAKWVIFAHLNDGVTDWFEVAGLIFPRTI